MSVQPAVEQVRCDAFAVRADQVPASHAPAGPRPMQGRDVVDDSAMECSGAIVRALTVTPARRAFHAATVQHDWSTLREATPAHFA